MSALSQSHCKFLLEMAYHLSLHLMLISTDRNVVSCLEQIEIPDKNIFLFSEFSVSLFLFSYPYKFLTLPTVFFLIELMGKFAILNTIKITDILPSNFENLV